MSRRNFTIYQDFAEAITPIISPAAPEGEITVDKWFQRRDNPVLRKALSAAVLAGSFFFFNTVPSLEAVAKVPDWHPQTNQPQRLVSKLSRQYTGEYRFEVP